MDEDVSVYDWDGLFSPLQQLPLYGMVNSGMAVDGVLVAAVVLTSPTRLVQFAERHPDAQFKVLTSRQAVLAFMLSLDWRATRVVADPDTNQETVITRDALFRRLLPRRLVPTMN